MELSGNLCSALGIQDTVSFATFNKAMDSAVSRIGKNSPASMNSIKDSIIDLVYRQWNIGFDPCDTIIETFLPHLVYKNRKGTCLGVSLIILMLAEKLKCPLYGVMLPGHFFCRYDDGTTRCNIEPNRSGIAHTDAYYRSRYAIDQQPWYDLADLSKKEVVGVACYNAGAICLNRNHYNASIAFFNESVRRIPGYKEARANRALTFAKKGDLDSAAVGFEALYNETPGLSNLALNYGIVVMAMHDCRKALTIFQKGASLYPADSALRSSIARAYTCIGDPAEAILSRMRQ